MDFIKSEFNRKNQMNYSVQSHFKVYFSSTLNIVSLTKIEIYSFLIFTIN